MAFLFDKSRVSPALPLGDIFARLPVRNGGSSEPSFP
jgi:hypothetical protein